ncbi:MAG: hypothetical protein EXR70_15560 [Deltaproteobacteria bacterium]|nr:hypothetical protein [Deltaproteobacteria bacterium]
MIPPTRHPLISVIVFACLPFHSGLFEAEILGDKPKHLSGVSSVANDQAITKMIWSPGLDDAFVPQGLAFADGAIFIGAYQSANPSVDRGQCRVFKVDPQTGKTLGFFNLPDDCGHAGGLVFVGKGVLVASDTRRLYKIEIDKALAAQSADAGLLSTVRLSGEVKGSFIDFDGASIFSASSEKDQSKARGHFFPLSIFDTHKGKTINQDLAVRTLQIGVEGQGAAYDREGNLWLSFSSSKYGSLQKTDPKTGQILAEYRMPIGIEDLAFDDEGRLWAVSEAGTLRWSKWSQKFPVVFQIDVSKLK